MSIEQYYIAPYSTDYPYYDLDGIEEFIIEGEEPMQIKKFKSRLEAYQYIQFKKDFLKYFRWSKYEQDGTKTQYTLYIKNGLKHRLDGPAIIETEYESTMFSDNTINVKETYYVDGVFIDKEDYNKHPQVREAKLNRILK